MASAGEAYRSFWGHVGKTFPSLKGAASTRYYFECERTLCEELFPELPARSLLKTDLWDEAKNTEVLRWAASRGARPLGIDIAFPIVAQAARLSWESSPRLAVADVRAIPFPPNSVELVYSMGTIEHFPDYRTAASEIQRVLKPGGIAIIGVPNKLDPFFRPALVWALNHLGWYAYGREKSFTLSELRRLLEEVGFRVTASSGILFMPGWLRMLDLLLYTRYPRFAWATAWVVGIFARAYQRFPVLRRHGYLIAVRAVKEGARADHGD
jgi:SAM-dependent methyltransferase